MTEFECCFRFEMLDNETMVMIYHTNNFGF